MITAWILPFRENSHGRTGNRTRDLMISSQSLWPLDHEAGRNINIISCIIFSPCKTAPPQPLLGQRLLKIEASRSHSDTPHSISILWDNIRLHLTEKSKPYVLHYVCWTHTTTNLREQLSSLTQRLQYCLRHQQKLRYQQKPKTARISNNITISNFVHNNTIKIHLTSSICTG